MENSNKWSPTKFIYRNGHLISSRDEREVSISSRLITDIVAKYYDKYLKLYAKGKLLDLGCGKVPFYEVYKDLVSNNICADWENSLHKNEFLDYTIDLTKQLPFDNESFDTIILSDVLEHIHSPEILWKEMQRVLTKGGKIIMNVPFYYRLHEKPYDYYRYTEFALKRYVEMSEMNLIMLEAIGGAPEIMADIFAKNIIHLPLVGKPLAIFTQYISFLFINTKFGKRVSSSTGRTFPFGYFLVAEKQ